MIFTSCSERAASGLLGLLGPSEQRRTCCPRQPHLLPLCFLADKISVHHSRSMLRRPPQRSTSSAWHFQELRLSLKYLLLFQTTLPLLARLETHLVPPSLADASCAVTAVSCPTLNPNKPQSHPLCWCRRTAIRPQPQSRSSNSARPVCCWSPTNRRQENGPCPNRQTYFLSSFVPIRVRKSGGSGPQASGAGGEVGESLRPMAMALLASVGRDDRADFVRK